MRPSTVQRVGAKLLGPGRSSPAPVALATSPRDLRDVLMTEPAFQSCPEFADAASWLARTAVSSEDFQAHLGSLPVSRVYEVVDECRRRARAWSEIASALEGRVRRNHPCGA